MLSCSTTPLRLACSRYVFSRAAAAVARRLSRAAILIRIFFFWHQGVLLLSIFNRLKGALCTQFIRVITLSHLHPAGTMSDVPSAAAGRAAAATNWQSIFTVAATIGVKLDADMRALALGGDAQVRKRPAAPPPRPPPLPYSFSGPTTICGRRSAGHRKSQKKHSGPSLFDRCPLEAFIRPLAPPRCKVTRRVCFSARHRPFNRSAAIAHLSNSPPLPLLSAPRQPNPAHAPAPHPP